MNGTRHGIAGRLAASTLRPLAFGLLVPFVAAAPQEPSPPPAATLILGTADLPQPLRRFDPEPGTPAPRLAFPPDGAVFPDAPLTVKLDGGRAPFTIIANGAPVITGARRRVLDLPGPGLGFSTLTVIDADGRSDRVTIRVK